MLRWNCLFETQMKKRTAYVWAMAVLCFVVLMIVTPAIPQSQSYHDFADKREFFGIPNTMDVVSNFPFLAIGLVGLVQCFRGNYFQLSLQGEIWGWMVFFIGVAAVAVGSSYYHLDPNDGRLVWDRLSVSFFLCLVTFVLIYVIYLLNILLTLYHFPIKMTTAFASIVAIFIIERIDERKGTLSIIPLLLAGVVSISYWRFFNDLRPYAVVQFLPCIAIPLMAILMPPMYTHSTYWFWAAAFYLLAKIEEAADKLTYNLTNHIVSGHTLKHLFAAMVPVFLALMLAKRTVEIQRLEKRRSENQHQPVKLKHS